MRLGVFDIAIELPGPTSVLKYIHLPSDTILRCIGIYIPTRVQMWKCNTVPGSYLLVAFCSTANLCYEPVQTIILRERMVLYFIFLL